MSFSYPIIALRCTCGKMSTSQIRNSVRITMDHGLPPNEAGVERRDKPAVAYGPIPNLDPIPDVSGELGEGTVATGRQRQNQSDPSAQLVDQTNLLPFRRLLTIAVCLASTLFCQFGSRTMDALIAFTGSLMDQTMYVWSKRQLQDFLMTLQCLYCSSNDHASVQCRRDRIMGSHSLPSGFMRLSAFIRSTIRHLWT